MHLFPWTRRRARRRDAIAEAQARQRADYDRAVRRITGQDVAAVDKQGGPAAATHPEQP
jgi:hypothetical protein